MRCRIAYQRRLPYLHLRGLYGQKKDGQNAVVPDSPSPGFAHKTLGNGITVSICQRCMKSIASPTPVSLRMAEENHLCGMRSRKSR